MRMRPFSRKEVTCFLLWVAIGLMLVCALTWWLAHSTAHERLHPVRSSPSSMLHEPDSRPGLPVAV
jgi:hypothetical protein